MRLMKIKQERWTQKIKKAQFDFEDYLESMNQMKKMGGLSSILSMMPGMSMAQMKRFDI